MFKILLTLSLLLTAGISAYMSVYGLVQVFAQYWLVVACMGAGMELGKILIVVYVHRRWTYLKLLPKFYYCFVVLALVLITSLEIFGFLSQSYSETGWKSRLIASRLDVLEKERVSIGIELSALDDTLKQLPRGYVTKTLREREKFGYKELRKRLLEIESERGELLADKISEDLRAGPIFAVARVISLEVEVAILAFIILLVGVLEPLSVGLTVAVSQMWLPRILVRRKMSPEHEERLERERLAAVGIKKRRVVRE